MAAALDCVERGLSLPWCTAWALTLIILPVASLHPMAVAPFVTWNPRCEYLLVLHVRACLPRGGVQHGLGFIPFMDVCPGCTPWLVPLL